MSDSKVPYRDRSEAGQRLAEALVPYRGPAVTVLGLPRGGVPVASVVADRLGADLDILVVRKVGAPGNREFGLGAVAEGGFRFLAAPFLREWGLRPEDLEAEVRVQSMEAERLARRLRGDRAFPRLGGRIVILVDDGMATGGSVRAAVGAVRRHRPNRVVIAVAVSSVEAMRALNPLVDDVVCPNIPPEFFAVGDWYREFPPVSESEVVALLRRHWGGSSAPIVRK